METTQPIVLIVDDSPESIDVLRGVLGVDYRVCVAINGARALEIAPTVKPDVILENDQVRLIFAPLAGGMCSEASPENG